MHSAVLGERDQRAEFAARWNDKRGGLFDEDGFAVEQSDCEWTEWFAPGELPDLFDAHKCVVAFVSYVRKRTHGEGWVYLSRCQAIESFAAREICGGKW
jgi:hypothetical protein